MSLNGDDMSSTTDEQNFTTTSTENDERQSLWDVSLQRTTASTSAVDFYEFKPDVVVSANVNNFTAVNLATSAAKSACFFNNNVSSCSGGGGVLLDKKSVGKFKFLSAPDVDSPPPPPSSQMNTFQPTTNIHNSSLYNGILPVEDVATTTTTVVQPPPPLINSYAVGSSSIVDEPPPPPPPPPLPVKRGRGRPSKNSLLQLAAARAAAALNSTTTTPIVKVDEIKVNMEPTKICVSTYSAPSTSIDDVVNDVVRNLSLGTTSTTIVSASAAAITPTSSIFIPTTIIKKGPLKKAILSELQQAQTTTTTEKTDEKTTTSERPTTPTRSTTAAATPNVSQPTTPDTGLKPKSRWYYRSEQETPSSTTSSTSELVTTTVVGSVATTNNDVERGLVTIKQEYSSQVVAILPVVGSSAPKFEMVEDNIYFSDKKRAKKGKDSTRMICECSKEEARESGIGCSDECLNRILYYECGSNCPCGSLCTNRKFQKHQYAKVEAFPAGAKGYGLRTLNFIAKHTFVIEYVGEVLNPGQFSHRKKQYAKDPNHSHHYFMALKSDQIIDATRKGNVSRFINHSCEPNCETQKWTVGGQLRIGFFTVRDVQPYEELTFDYRFQRYGKEAQKCYCGAPTCRGYIDGGEQKVKVSAEREERKKEKETKTVFEDALFDHEFEDTVAIGCLRNKDQVVTFGRLMLRADDYESRRQLLDLLLKTEKNVLRLFIDLHGCRLLWSWTVDEETCGENWQDLQLKLLDVLKILPIPHKNMLQDSRLLSTIERWSKIDKKIKISRKKLEDDVEECVSKTLFAIIDQICSGLTPTSNESTEATPMDEDFDNKECLAASICAEENLVDKFNEVKKQSDAILVQWSTLKENFKIPKKIEKKDEKGLTSAEENKEKTPPGTSSVLIKSKKLKKHGKITPKKGNDVTKSSGSSGSGKHEKKSSESRSRSRSGSRSKSTSKSSDRDRVAVYRYLDYGLFRFRRSPSPSHRHKKEKEKEKERKRAHSPESSAADREKLKRSKEDRRRMFEELVAREDEKKLYERQLQDYERENQIVAEESLQQQQHQQMQQQQPPPTMGAGGGVYWDHTPTIPSGATPAPPPTTYPPTLPQPMGHPQAVPPPTMPDTVGAIAAGFQPTGTRPAEFVLDPMTQRYWWRDQSTGVLVYPATSQQITAMAVNDHSVVPHFYHDPATGLIHEVHMRMQVAAPVAVPQTYDLRQERHEPVDMVCVDDELTRQQRIDLLREQIAALQNQLDQKQSELNFLLEQEESESSPNQSNDRPPSHLPTNWRTAMDGNGKYYYYHVITKKTQWDPPSFDDERISPPPSSHVKKVSTQSSSTNHQKRSSSSSSLKTPSTTTKKQQISDRHHRSSSSHGRKDRSEQQRKMKAALKIKNAAFLPKKSAKSSTTSKLLAAHQKKEKEHSSKKISPPKSSTAETTRKENETADDASSSIVTPFGTTTAAADTSSEVARKFKEGFKSAISNHVIKYLNSYRKNDCKVGRITNNDDFKHLARKLTHAVMEKELKHCHRVEDLHVTDSVLHKAKDYIKRYMSKLGPTYKRSASSP